MWPGSEKNNSGAHTDWYLLPIQLQRDKYSSWDQSISSVSLYATHYLVFRETMGKMNELERQVCGTYKALGVGMAQWLESRTCDWKVAGSNPCWSGGGIFFSGVDFLFWLLFQYLFHPHVTTVAHKRSRSFCQKWRWQVTAKHAYTLRMWLCMKWYGAWLYGVHRTCAETAAVSCGTSHAST